MSESDRVGKSDNVQWFSIVSASLREALAGNAKKRMFAQMWFCYISIAKVWGLDYEYVLLTKLDF